MAAHNTEAQDRGRSQTAPTVQNQNSQAEGNTPHMSLTTMDYRSLKAKLHSQLLEEIDLESLNRLSEGVARERVGVVIRDMLHRQRTPLASVEREQIVVEILDELFGLGPLEPLLADGTISDILVNGSQKVYIERRGVLHPTGAKFDDDAHLMRIIDRI